MNVDGIHERDSEILSMWRVFSEVKVVGDKLLCRGEVS